MKTILCPLLFIPMLVQYLFVPSSAINLSLRTENTETFQITDSRDITNPKTPSPSYESLIDSADNAIKSEDWNKAISFYQEALKLNPGSPLNSKLFVNLGICFTKLNKYPEALQSYEIAIIKEPQNPDFLYKRAITLLLTGDDKNALYDLDKAIEIDSLSIDSRRLRGQIMLKYNELEKALEDFNIIYKADPNEPWGAAGLGEIAYLRSDYKEAVSFLTKALELEENPDFRISLISTFLQLNLLQEAEGLIRESILLYPTSGEFYVMRGRLHKILHQNREVEQDKKIAIQYGIDPQIIEQYLPEISK